MATRKRSRSGVAGKGICVAMAVGLCLEAGRSTSLVPSPMPGPTVDFLSEEAKARMHEGKNKFEKIKAAKDPSLIWNDIGEFARDLREGKYGWDEIDADDLNVRLKWLGFFHRPKDAKGGRFMVRLKMPNGLATADQLDFIADQLEAGEDSACLDITTRANFQLRGIRLDQADTLMGGIYDLGLSVVQSGMDNVRNIVGSPIAGIDPHEIIDTRPLAIELNDLITGDRRGNPEFSNFPRKINIAISGSRDDFAHTHVNDIGLEPALQEGEVGFNVVLGGYFSAKRTATSVPIDLWLPVPDVVHFTRAVLEIFRDHGERSDRAQTRLLWLVEAWGVETFRERLVARMAELSPSCAPRRAAQHEEGAWPRRDVLGVHPQKQEGTSWVGVSVPAGRLTVEELRHVSRLAREYAGNEVRLTVEQNIIFPNVDNSRVQRMLEDPIFKLGRLEVEAGNLVRGLVSCTGSQFCPVGIIETKARAERTARILESLLDIPQLVRFHWTGCPNQCGVPQIADIGLLGGPAKIWSEEKGKMVATEGVRIFTGGKIGEGAELGNEADVAVPTDEAYLIPHLSKLLVTNHNAKLKPGFKLVESIETPLKALTITKDDVPVEKWDV